MGVSCLPLSWFIGQCLDIEVDSVFYDHMQSILAWLLVVSDPVEFKTLKKLLCCTQEFEEVLFGTYVMLTFISAMYGPLLTRFLHNDIFTGFALFKQNYLAKHEKILFKHLCT